MVGNTLTIGLMEAVRVVVIWSRTGTRAHEHTDTRLKKIEKADEADEMGRVYKSVTCSISTGASENKEKREMNKPGKPGKQVRWVLDNEQNETHKTQSESIVLYMKAFISLLWKFTEILPEETRKDEKKGIEEHEG